MKVYIKHAGKTLELKASEIISIGREGHNNTIELSGTDISRHHAKIIYQNHEVLVIDNDSLNGVKVNGSLIQKSIPRKLKEGDKVSILGHEIQVIFQEIKQEKNLKNGLDESRIKPQRKNLIEIITKKEKLSIGRNPDNDIVLSEMTVGRFHAQITLENNQYFLEDLDSKNGTFLNGKRVIGKTPITLDDEIIIELHSIILNRGAKNLRKEKVAISANKISRVYPNGGGLQPISLQIPEGEFIALMGPSGCGKSTLLKSLSNVEPPYNGSVKIHGLDTKTHFSILKTKIGYVPQDDIIHLNLSVYYSLFFAAKLRLADDTKDEEINSKIDSVLKSLKLPISDNFKKTLVKKLSGGQRKRISIAVELLTDPTILFLDEPTSPLDPETIDSFLSSIKELTKNGTTVIMVTHKPEDLQYADKVIFFMVKGYITFFGLPSDLNKRFEVDDIIKVYSKLSYSEDSDLADDKRLFRKNKDLYYLKTKEGLKNQAAKVPQDEDKKSIFNQFYWLTSRYYRIKLSDRSNLGLLLAQPIIIAALVTVIFDEIQVGVLFLMAISAIWFGVSNAAKEIVGELSIFSRERMFNLKLHPYILSKWAVLSLIALIQTFIFILILYLKFKLVPNDVYDDIYLYSFSESFAFMAYLAISASLIGLLLSSKFNTTERVMTVVPIALMPQIMLSGVITKIDNQLIEFLSFLMLGRWGTEGLGRIQDSGYSEGEGSVLQLNSCPDISASQPVQETSEFVRVFVGEGLNLYYDNSIGEIFNSFDANIVAVSILNIVSYLFIFQSLKQKKSK